MYEVDNEILIPCINVGVSECLLNVSKQLNYIDYCYLVYIGVRSIQVNTSSKLLSGAFDGKAVHYIGATNIASENRQGELEIAYDHMYLVLKSDSKISNQMWIPTQTPYLKPNLIKEDVQKFLIEQPGFVRAEVKSKISL